jgi:hypothetical protein
MGNNAKNNEKKQWKRGSKRDNRGGRELPGPRGPFIVGRASPISLVFRRVASFGPFCERRPLLPSCPHMRGAGGHPHLRGSAGKNVGLGTPLRLLRKVRAPQRTRPVLNDILAARATIGKNKRRTFMQSAPGPLHVPGWRRSPTSSPPTAPRGRSLRIRVLNGSTHTASNSANAPQARRSTGPRVVRY